MEERIAARLADLRAAEQETHMRLVAIRTAIGELEALLKPDEPLVSGEPLGQQEA